MSDIAAPNINENEILIKVRAISINPVDVKTRSGSAMAKHLSEYKPLILGWDIAGVVVERGNSVENFNIGDDVFGLINFLGHGKGYAEYVAAPADQVAKKPSNISYGQAAAATLAALTAWQLLNNYAKVKSGDKILIQAASGGVGHYAVQIAKYLGAYVIGISSSANRQFVIELGADKHIAYDLEAFEETVQDIDIIVDAFAGDNLYKSLKAVKRGGIIISLLPMIGWDILEKAKEKNVTIHYSLVKSDGGGMKSIADLLARGSIKSHVSGTYPFSQMKDAHLSVETGKTIGKVVVTV